MGNYMTSTQGQLDALGHATGFNIGQSITNAANAAGGYSNVGAYEQAPKSYSGGVAGNSQGDIGASGGATYSDPYAAYGGTAAFNNLVNGYNTQRDQVYSSAGDAVANAGIGIGSGIQDLLYSTGQQQNKLNNRSVQDLMAKTLGARGVQDTVSQGIQSSGVMLANKNASDSSAAGALANAYGKIGRGQLSSVNNQFAQAEDQVAQDQTALEGATALSKQKILDQKTQTINSIVSDAQGKMAALDAQIASASLPNRINIEGAKQQVRANAIAALSQYDQQLSDGLAGIRPQDKASIMSKANSLISAGAVPETTFQYQDQAPVAQQQGSGPTTSNLPIYTAPRKELQSATV